MTQTKLEIIGPYTPDHEGPFCCGSDDLVAVYLRLRNGRGEFPLHGYIGDDHLLARWREDGSSPLYSNLMNAREVPVAREFWLSEYGDGALVINRSKDHAEYAAHLLPEIIRTIHVREVLPGED